MSGRDAAEEQTNNVREISARQLTSICVAQLNEAIQITMPYTLAVYMIRGFEAEKHPGSVDEEEVGRLTGLLAACFCAAQFVSSWPWGVVSDRIGRKPMLIMSNVSSCASVILFGLSGNFKLAAIFRLMGGLFNCTFVCLKSMIGESCDTQAQARPMSILSLCWGLGTVIGPSLGGGLSQPCQTFNNHFPLCKSGQLFQERPFFLPCLVVGFVSLAAAFCSIFIVEETLPAIVAKRYKSLAATENEVKATLSNLSEVELARLAEADPLVRHESDNSVTSDHEAQSLIAPGTESSDFLHYDSPLIASNVSDLESNRPVATGFVENNLSTPTKAGWPLRTQSKVADQLKKIEAEKELDIVWYKQPQIILVISGYVMICLLYNLLDEITPIYGSAERQAGGLAFTTTQLASPIVAGGISIFIWNLFFYTWYQKTLGLRNACRLALVMSIPLAILIGVPSLLPLGPLGLQIALASILFVKNICATNAFTSTVLMVNAIAPQKDIGSVNGAAQASASLMRAVGPAIGGLIWGASVSLNVTGHQLLGFVITGVGYVGPLLLFGALRAPQLGRTQNHS